MNIIFIEPCFPNYQRHFVRALAQSGARVTGIGETPIDQIADEIARHLVDYKHVHSVVDEGALEWAVRQVQAHEWVDRLEATIESHVLPAAHVRERCTIPGTTSKTAYLCRDKPTMKQVLREAGVPTASSAGVSSAEQAWSFVREVGFPIIIKPRSAAGSEGAWRIDTIEEFDSAILANGIDRGASVALEEFVEGHEGIYDSITINGTIAHEFIAHYYPNVLEAMRERWITPYMVVTNRIHEPAYEELRKMARRVNYALGITTSATHMEWFFGNKGLKFSEIGCRPAGQGAWDLYCAANDVDVYREWALAVTEGRTERQMTRKFAAGMVSLRPQRDGIITGYEGIETIERAYGDCVIDCHFPEPGTPTQPISSGMNANAWIRMRHPDFDRLCAIFDEIGHTIKVHAG